MTRQRRPTSATIPAPYVPIARLDRLIALTRGHGECCPCDACRELRAA